MNRRSWEELHAEIRRIQTAPKVQPGWKFTDVFPRLPRPIRRFSLRMILRRPDLMKAYAGTVGFTSVGMFGVGSFWGIGLPVHSLAVTLGGIGEKPVVVDGRIAIREMLSLTVSFNHDIIDGAPAARFTQRLIEEMAAPVLG